MSDVQKITTLLTALGLATSITIPLMPRVPFPPSKAGESCCAIHSNRVPWLTECGVSATRSS